MARFAGLCVCEQVCLLAGLHDDLFLLAGLHDDLFLLASLHDDLFLLASLFGDHFVFVGLFGDLFSARLASVRAHKRTSLRTSMHIATCAHFLAWAQSRGQWRSDEEKEGAGGWGG